MITASTEVLGEMFSTTFQDNLEYLYSSNTCEKEKKKALICSVCQFLWYKLWIPPLSGISSYHNDVDECSIKISIHLALLSQYDLVSVHHWFYQV